MIQIIFVAVGADRKKKARHEIPHAIGFRGMHCLTFCQQCQALELQSLV